MSKAFLSSAKPAIFFARIRDDNEAFLIAGVLLVQEIDPIFRVYECYRDNNVLFDYFLSLAA